MTDLVLASLAHETAASVAATEKKIRVNHGAVAWAKLAMRRSELQTPCVSFRTAPSPPLDPLPLPAIAQLMPHLFKTRDGTVWKPGKSVALTLPDGTKAEGVWAGSAQEEKLGWWLRPPGSDLGQTEEVAEIAVKDEDTDELRWGVAPEHARIFFVLQPPATSKTGHRYRLAKMVTTAATEAQHAYFNDERFSLFGTLNPDGTIHRIPPLQPPPSDRLQQGELC